MPRPARLVATVSAPLHPSSADAPRVLHWPGRRLLVQRGDLELVTVDLRDPQDAAAGEVRFPTPWPRRFGTVTTSPEQDAALFCGVHELRLVDATGTDRWALEHGCWAGTCTSTRLTIEEYLVDSGHANAEEGSAAFSADNSLVWAHVPGPIRDDPSATDEQELWVVLNPGTGRVLGHAETMTVASSSEHTPHPDPAQMGLSVGEGEGEEGSPVLWGRFDGTGLTVDRVGSERILLDVSPTGQSLLTVPVGQWSLTTHSCPDGRIRGNLDAAGVLPSHPMSTDDSRVYWDFEAAFLDDATIVAGTSESDPRLAPARHWVIDAGEMTLIGEVGYPFPVTGPARSAGDGLWYTVSTDGTTVHFWQLA